MTMTRALICATLLVSGAVACSRAKVAAPAGAQQSMFRGVYEAGAGRSAFIPCGSGEQWYVSTASAAARELWRRMGAQDMQAPGGGMLPSEKAVNIRRAYASVRGDTIALTPGRSAFTYARELRVAEVLDVQPAQGTSCPGE